MKDHEALVSEFLSISASRRALRIRNGGRFQTPRFGAALLRHGFSLRYQDPRGYLELSELAGAVSSTLAASPETFDLDALSQAHSANALRILGDYACADKRFSAAEGARILGTGSPDLLAQIRQFQGSFLETVRDFPGALLALRTAETIRSHTGGPGLARVLTQIGIVLCYSGDPHGATKALRAALPHVSDEENVRLVLQPLIWACVDCGEADLAAAMLEEGRGLLAAGPVLFRLKVQWLEGRIYAGLGGLRGARAHLEEARSLYLEHGLVLETALTSLDLAIVEGRLGYWSRVRELGAEALPILRALGLGPDSLAAQLVVRSAARQEVAALQAAWTLVLRQPPQSYCVA